MLKITKLKWLLFGVACGLAQILPAQKEVLATEEKGERYYSPADKNAALRTKKGLNESYILRGKENYRFRNEVKKTMACSWENLGPNYLPEQLNPGKKAIPDYALNRGNGTGRINYLYMNPKNSKHLFACSPTGGLWYTEDNGLNWQLGGTDQLPKSGVAAITVHEEKKLTAWYIVTGDGDDDFDFSDGVWRSFDKGKKWENISLDKGENGIPFSPYPWVYTYASDIQLHPCDKNRLYVATNTGIYATANALASAELVKWKKIVEGDFYDIEFKPDEPNVIYASGETLMVSKDCGLTWNRIPNPEVEDSEPYVRLSIEVSPSNPDRIFAVYTSADGRSFDKFGPASYHIYNTKTSHWQFVSGLTKKMNNVIGPRGRAFAVSPTDTSLVIVGNVRPLYRSTNGGLSFERVALNQSHDDTHHILFSPDGKTVWTSNDGDISLSTDDGATWTKMANGIGAANVFGLCAGQTVDPQIVYGGYDTGGNMLLDGQWYHVSFGDGFEGIIARSDSSLIVTTRQGGSLCISDNRGEDFERKVGRRKTKGFWHSWVKGHPLKDSTIYLAGTDLVRSCDFGSNWEVILEQDSLNLPGNRGVYRFFHDKTHPDWMYAFVLTKEKKSKIYRTGNINEIDPLKIVWEEVKLEKEIGWIGSICMTESDPRNFYVVNDNFERREKIFFYENGVLSDITSNLGFCIPVSMIRQHGPEDRLYVGTGFGVWTKTKSEEDWTLMKGMPGVKATCFDINYKAGKLLVGTFGRGIWQTDLLN